MLKANNQQGFALLMFVVVLVLISGVLISGHSETLLKKLEQKKIQKNKLVLEEAKHALLMYAFNYPTTVPNAGPGRLPCPDTDNDGSPNASFLCITGGAAMVGRFPWGAAGMNFYDIKDADGESLWYAVSREFANSQPGGGPVNYNSIGEITIRSQTVDVIYDGTTGNGVAAVIIAPGAISNRDENDDGVLEFEQLRGTAAQQLDPINYLDHFFGNDNSQFDNDGTDGFRLGPVEDSTQNTTVLNDQIIVITTDEINKMMAKSLAQNYKQAIDTYQLNIWGGVDVDYRYPWLDDYGPDALNVYDATIGASIGRVPSIFGDYFNDANTSSIDSDIKTRFFIEDGGSPSLMIERLIAGSAIDVNFDNNTDLLATSTAANNSVETLYFWDSIATPNGWELCDTGVNQTDTPADCNQSLANPGVPNALVANQIATKVLEVEITINVGGASLLTFENARRTASNLIYQAPDTANNAFVYAGYSDVVLGGVEEIQVDYIIDNFYLNTFDPIIDEEVDEFRIGLIYYPLIPLWSLDNDFHNSVMLAYSNEYAPDQDGVCDPGVDCLTVVDYSGIDNKQSLFVNSLGHAGLATQNLIVDPVAGIFDAENDDSNTVFLSKSDNNDLITLIGEI